MYADPDMIKGEDFSIFSSFSVEILIKYICVSKFISDLEIQILEYYYPDWHT